MAKKGRPDPRDAAASGGFDMTPMIDVTFLLIIFFMCVTEMADASKAKMILPRAMNGIEDIFPPPGRLLINITKNGDVWINSVLYNDDKLKATLKAQATLNKKEGSAFSDQSVLIRADEDAKYEDVQKVMIMCVGQGMWKISFTAKPPKPQGA